jgi:hypothetical protein
MSEDRYVHDPDAVDGDDSFEADDADALSAEASSDDPAERTFDWHNWLLVAALVVAFLVVPAFILYQPVRINSFVFTYLVLPLVPAFLLGALAVWAATR